ncbi:MAG: adenylate/guanylate cyclase domain-containing protein, partial [Spirochaetes bacterium]|nr:adenylate/guanylate cyclase domain-containing protein [Spirochaetota bacterium]
GKKIYYPAREKDFSEELIKNLDNFQRGLKLYYDGDWKNAYKEFLKCSLSLADVFKDRTLNYDPPKDWNGIWTMTTK